MLENRVALIFLDSFNFMTYSKKKKFLELFSAPKEIFNRGKFVDNKDKLTAILTSNQYKNVLDNLNDKYLLKVVEKLNKLSIKTLTIYDEDYPELLKNIDTPPYVLYYKGDKAILHNLCIGVVGSRKITNYGVMATEKFTRELVKYGFTIVSGLAYGVDKTIAVLAGGLDKIYPTANNQLANKVIETGGVLISEMPPGTKLEAHMFPIRNRIIAGLSKAVLITEAQETSGALHTKNYALDYGRDVFAVMGSIFSDSSRGTNRMIVNGHANAVCQIEDIVEEYHLVPYIQKQEERDISSPEQVVLDFLKDGEKAFQEIVDGTGLNVSTLNTLLTKLSIRGIVKKLAGNTFYLK